MNIFPCGNLYRGKESVEGKRKKKSEISNRKLPVKNIKETIVKKIRFACRRKCNSPIRREKRMKGFKLKINFKK